MKVQVTNQQVFNFHNEIGMWEGDSILFYFLNSKVKEFHNNNRIRIATMLDKYNALMADHYVIESGQIKMEAEPYPLEIIGEETQEQKHWKETHTPVPVLTGKTTQDEYEAKRNAFLLETTTLEL